MQDCLQSIALQDLCLNGMLELLLLLDFLGAYGGRDGDFASGGFQSTHLLETSSFAWGFEVGAADLVLEGLQVGQVSGLDRALRNRVQR